MTPCVALTLNFRDAARTIRCVDALMSQGIRHAVIWDNSQDDGKSASTLREHFSHTPGVSVICSAWNVGFASGVNRGLSACRDLHGIARVLLINNDARPAPGAVERLAMTLDTHPDAYFAYPSIESYGRITHANHYQRWTGLLLRNPTVGTFLYPSGCCMLLASNAAIPPLFDEDFFMYGEDTALAWNLLRKSTTPFAFAEGAVVIHEGSASSGLGSLFYETHMLKAHLLLARKLATNTAQSVLFFCLRLPVLLARSIFRCLKLRNINPLTAWLYALGGRAIQP